MQNYQYPIDLDWSHEEMTKVIALWNAVESAYETGINRDEFLSKYRAFKEVVPSIGEEKRYGKAFERESGYSLYHVVKNAKESTNQKVQMKSNKEGRK